ncbi:MAG: GTPase Era [Candidatus Bipolaricaulota bacterium]|nr:MAG: GTPase Era [Candidatus Bipolaricaulota bacterium]
MEKHRAGFVAVLGQTNVGKSTFLNAVLGRKLLITSEKPQATRNRVRCILTTEEAQIVFVDTPGLHRPVNRLSQFVLREAFRALRGVDLLVYMVEPWGEVAAYDRTVFERLCTDDRPAILLVNKTDRARGNALEETLLAYDATDCFDELIPVSSTRGTNLEDAVATIVRYLPEGAPLFPEEMASDQSETFLIRELIREKVYQVTHEEIPYSTAVAIRHLESRDDGLLDITAEVIVDKPSQKGILIGAQGRRIKEIGSRARADIESMFGTRVYLDLKVKVIRGWTKDREQIRELTGPG